MATVQRTNMPRPPLPLHRKRVPLSVYLRPLILERLKEQAQAAGLPPATLAARLIREGVNHAGR